MRWIACKCPTVVTSNLVPLPAANLRLLMVLRTIAVTGQVAAIVVVRPWTWRCPRYDARPSRV